ncbi:hypothetical protein [Aliarcobacter cryaerophilus]|uniref:Uncharacterized protein n=1 Tax=Aliarcobacter cryaerophilus TaxID=28198 RepID=A0AA46NU02_9BACT|nr:hypothetical protein [Aliarcobacter cryaerophilus]UYF42538.1 hypothetical protein NGX11_06400 [Aliarcobacter cryaerophilus]
MRAENKPKVKKEKKLFLLESYFSFKNQFLSIEKLISDNFQKYSLNEILDFKETLQELYLKMRYFVKKLRKYHKVYIDIEKRDGFI